MTWRLAGGVDTFRAAVNARWPRRDKASDGTIGDASHSARSSSSDHNPFVVVGGVGVVRAVDVDVDGIDAGWLAEQLRLLGSSGDHRLTGGGYVILNRRITRPDFSGWCAYTGSNPHDKHMHLSFSRARAGFDDQGPWRFLTGAAQVALPTPAAPVGHGQTTVRQGSTGDAVRRLQSTLNRWYPKLTPLTVDGQFGPGTAERVRYFQTKAGLTADGIVGPATWATLGFK